MKGAYILLEKNGVLLRTQYTSPDSVRWLDGEKRLAELSSEGYKVVEVNLVNKALKELEKLRDGLCAGWKVTNSELLDIIKLLRDY